MRRRPRKASVALCLGLALLAGRATATEGLALDPGDPRLSGHPDLVARLAATPHGYFRFVNAAFASETCRLFSADAATLPEVNLHGDAHVEQYTVTSLGRGLSDFDDCTRGQPVIDLVRFGSSLVLAARQKGWGDRDRQLVGDFLRGYRDGLGGGRLRIDMPAVATRLRSRFTWDHGRALANAHKL